MTLAYGALALLLALSAAALLSRRLATPARRRPVDRTAARLRPVEVSVNDLGFCPAEDRITLHAYYRHGARQCFVCRAVTPAGGAR